MAKALLVLVLQSVLPTLLREVADFLEDLADKQESNDSP